MRVFALSDVHADFPENQLLLAGLSGYREDALILAGDVSHDVTLLRTTLGMLLERFRYVFFVPGNHELWVSRGEYEHSLQKFHAIVSLCESLGVRVAPECIGEGADRVCVVPLFSWYTRPEEGEDSLYVRRQASGAGVWMDDFRIQWPVGFRPAQAFHDMNEMRSSAAQEVPRISFSHFVPRADLMFASAEESLPLRPDPRARRFDFSRVAGSTLIEKQIRKLGSRIHIYGHQHRNRHRCCEGIWYVSNCLGYPQERRRRSVLNPATLVRAVWPPERATGKRAGRGETVVVAVDS